MKIKFGSIVTDGRGKLGGHVYSKNKAGAYVRTNVIPSNPDTIAQRLVRQTFGRISQQWAALSATNKKLWLEATADWKTTDQFGDLKALTAKALYQGLNTQAEQAGFSIEIKKPMPKMDLETVAITKAVISLGSETVEFSETIQTLLNVRYQVFATGILSAGILSYKGKEKLLFNRAVLTEAEVFSKLVGKVGAMSLSDNIYIGVRAVGSNGQAGVLQMVKATIEA